MPKRKQSLASLSDFLLYLAKSNGNGYALPSLAVLGEELGASVASVREQLAVARALGWVEVKPRTGIRRLSYSFYPTVRHSVAYAIELDEAYFRQFASLRNHLEAAYWLEAVQLLTKEDKDELLALLVQAMEKLERSPVQIPHQEHRKLHLLIYTRLENTFVTGIFESYWDLYEAMGLDVFADLQYLKHIWQYHEQMVRAICEERYQQGFDALIEHKDLLYRRPQPKARQKFE
ncbi:MAG: FCD domain-containing protein [Anaerolineaceae bacterium]|jgi:DNA-binding FadR family transcriptional regulator|nr:FCD domain-containing protein [Anaerolineaceae bacterium]